MSVRFIVGDAVHLDNTFTVDDVPTDPTTISLSITAPDDTVTTYTYAGGQITRDSAGVYHKDIAVSSVGEWSWLWEGTGSAAGVESGTFNVFAVDPIRSNYCTLDELKAELGIGEVSSDTFDDSKAQLSIAAASRQIDGFTGWRFWQDAVATARTFRPTDGSLLSLLDDPSGDGIATTTGLIVALDAADVGTYGTTLTIDTDYFLGPLNAATRSPAWPYTEINLTGITYSFNGSAYNRPTVQITAKWGWPAVPDDIHKACLVQAAQLFKAKDAAFGVAGLAGLDGIGMRAGEWNPIARGLLVNYRKPSIG